jgi:hypothetical protein
MENILVSSLAAAYVIFVFQRKRGPFGIFRRARAKLRLLGGLGYHFLCPTCAALSVGIIFYALLHIAPIVVTALAVPGAIAVLHGLSGYYHAPDDDEESA